MNAFDALGNPLRRELLERVALGPSRVGQLAQSFAVSRPAISRHLKILEEAGFVQHESVGRENYYRVCRQGFSETQRYLERLWAEALPRFKLVAENLSKDD